MKYSIIILCFSCVLLLVIFFLSSKHTKEHFVVKNFRSLKDELERDSCDMLWSDDMDPVNKATAGTYLKSKRISKWKSVNDNGDYSCYMLDDIDDRAQDPFMAKKRCETAFPNVPFILNTRVDNSQQTTTQVRTDACVFDIDNNNKTVTNLNDFWSNIALQDDCIQANLYIIELYDSLIRTQRTKYSELSNVTESNIILSKIKTNLDDNINFYTSEISTSNVILTTIKDNNYVLTNSNINLKFFLGKIESELKTYTTTYQIYINDLSNINNIVKSIYDSNQLVINNSNITKNERISESNIWSESNNKLLARYEQLNKDFGILNENIVINTSNVKQYTALKFEFSNLYYTQLVKNSNLLTDKQILNSSNIIKEEQLNICLNNETICSSYLSNCRIECSNLITWTDNYNNMSKSNEDALVMCKQRNVSLNETIKNMNLYFQWVRSVYIYLSCDSFKNSLASAEQSYSNMSKACNDADDKINKNIATANSLYSRSEINAQSNLETCTSNVANIRNDINSKVFKDEVFIHGEIKLACDKGEFCPIRNQNEANVLGDDVCDTIKDAYYTGRYLNYDGQRGAVYCSYWGDTKMFDEVRSNNKIIKKAAGNVLPAGSYSNKLPNCYASNFTLRCPNVEKPYNFRDCGNYISYSNDNLSCRPDGYNYKVSHIAICAADQQCKLSGNGGSNSKNEEWIAEMVDYCNRYALVKPDPEIRTMAY